MTIRPANTSAAARNTQPKWKSSVMPVGPLAVRMPSSGPSRTNVTSAASADSFTAGIRLPVAGTPVATVVAAIPSDLLDLGPAKQAGRQEDQDHNQDPE